MERRAGIVRGVAERTAILYVNATQGVASRAARSGGGWGRTTLQQATLAGRTRQPLGARRLVSVAVRVAMFTAMLTYALVVAKTMVTSGRLEFQFDFRGDLYGAGRAIVHGLDPYQPGLLDAQAATLRAGETLTSVASPRYPPPILLAVVPLSLLPFIVAAVVFLLLSAGAVMLALWLLGVRDWRCFAIAAVSWPTVFGVWLGNVSPLLLLGGAAAWRWRGRLRGSAFAIAAVVAAKLFLWPVGVWLLVTKRFRTLALAVLSTVVTVFAAWAVIGFAGMAAYPHMLSNVASIGEARGQSLVAFLLAVGLPVGAARVVAVAVAVAMLGAAARLARRADGEGGAYGLAVMAGLTASPVVWGHYLVLLFIPIALSSPRLSPLWLLPMLAGIVPPSQHPVIWDSVPALGIELFIVAWLCLPLLDLRAVVRRGVARRAHGLGLGRSPADSRRALRGAHDLNHRESAPAWPAFECGPGAGTDGGPCGELLTQLP